MTNIWEDLGIRPVINAQGNRTLLGGSTPVQEVQDIMDEMDEYYVDMGELIDTVSTRIAEMLDVEAALVTSGCAAALAVGAAGIMTGKDDSKIEQIPDVTGMRYEFVIQRQLRVKYDRCVTIPGGKLIEVGEEESTTPEQIEAAIGPNTAAIHYLAPGDRPGCVPMAEVLDIAHSRDIPVIVDAAGEVYPTDRLSKYVGMGADLVCYGAKYFGAVNSSGILTGKKDYVEAARLNSFIGFESTTTRSFARPMKLDRQEVVAVYAALRRWLTMNHEDRFATYETQISNVQRSLDGVSGVSTELAESGPTDSVLVTIDASVTGKTAKQVLEEMGTGSPSIWAHTSESMGLPPGGIVLRMRTVREGQESAIAERIRDLL